MEQGFDPEVKKYFRKIINSFSWSFLWMFANVIAGLYYGLGYRGDRPFVYTIVFYIVSVFTLVLLLRYLYRIWSK